MASPLHLPRIHHYAYLIDELDVAARRLHAQFGAGPFFYIEEVPVTNVTSRGEPAEFMHGAAFGMCNQAAVELMQIVRVTPQRVDQRFSRTRCPRIQHVAYVLPPSEVDGVRAELEERGVPEYMRSRLGQIETTLHDAGAAFGYDLELHADNNELRAFFTLVREAADGWDGSELMRRAPV
ncbi:MAG: VOC family protein [Actinobacteria bacterium]|nr:VOC family protein [Actinomycetota bacterium]MBV9890440.1 VOC family protein [Rhizobacter sp.]